MLLFACGPQLGLGFLVWVAFVPLLWALSAEPRMGFAQGWLVGVIAHGLSFPWMVPTVAESSGLGTVGGVLLWAAFAAFTALQYGAMFGLGAWLKQRIGGWWVVALAVFAVACEQAFPQLFPYRLGHFQYDTPWVWQLASVTGPLGISALIVLTNAVLVERRWPALVGVGVLHGLNLGFGAVRHAQVEARLAGAPVLEMGIVQQDVTLAELKARSRADSVSSWDVEHLDADLVVLPEAAVKVNPWDEDVRDTLAALAPDLLVGGGTYEVRDGYRYKVANTMTHFRRDSDELRRHDKQVLMPFGEYLPGATVFPGLPELVGRPPDMRAGDQATTFEGTMRSGEPYRFAVPICYAGMLPGEMQALYESDSWDGPVDLFIVVSNDSWFGDTAAPYQHAMVASGFATMFGRPLTLNALTGVSRVVEPHGDIVWEAAPFEELSAVVPVRMGRVDTVYAAGGWLFGWICVGFAPVILIGAATRRD
ncbi:MAG: apolipoprotein N-acyltransferase [Proteobacteria bacterium]|nr:apolipoprotein N-acyltransferase [Pseudomonadota bacterium]MCP4918541.1 apolipoprotein N-acyltransferase [Pseudomonadota bacterium]